MRAPEPVVDDLQAASHGVAVAIDARRDAGVCDQGASRERARQQVAAQSNRLTPGVADRQVHDDTVFNADCDGVADAHGAGRTLRGGADHHNAFDRDADARIDLNRLTCSWREQNAGTLPANANRVRADDAQRLAQCIGADPEADRAAPFSDLVDGTLNSERPTRM